MGIQHRTGNNNNSNKEMKYNALANTHIFFTVAIETSGMMNQLAVDLVSERLARRISSVTGHHFFNLILKNNNKMLK